MEIYSPERISAIHQAIQNDKPKGWFSSLQLILYKLSAELDSESEEFLAPHKYFTYGEELGKMMCLESISETVFSNTFGVRISYNMYRLRLDQVPFYVGTTDPTYFEQQSRETFSKQRFIAQRLFEAEEEVVEPWLKSCLTAGKTIGSLFFAEQINPDFIISTMKNQTKELASLLPSREGLSKRSF